MTSIELTRRIGLSTVYRDGMSPDKQNGHLQIEITVGGQIDASGALDSRRSLEEALEREVTRRFSGQDLNLELKEDSLSAEKLARVFFEILAPCFAKGVLRRVSVQPETGRYFAFVGY
jgi:6-pyruvoyl-tetrahydropterin synthase